MRVFWERGYEAASMEELIQAMGISPSSLYATFGGKQKLYEAAIERYAAGPGSYADRVLRSEPSVLRGLGRLLETAAVELTKPDQPMGCMVALAVTHGSAEAAPIRRMMAERRAQSREMIAERLAAGVANGELPADTDVAALARLFAAVFHGMSIQARDGATTAELRAVAKMATANWLGAVEQADASS